MHFWSTCLLWIWTKIIETIRKWTKTLISNAIDFLSGIYDQMLARRFGPLSNYPNMYFWSRFKLRTWTKRTSVMHIIFNKGQYTLKIQHVIPLEILEFQYWIPWHTFLGRKLDPFVSGQTYLTHYFELTSAFLIILDVFKCGKLELSRFDIILEWKKILMFRY